MIEKGRTVKAACVIRNDDPTITPIIIVRNTLGTVVGPSEEFVEDNIPICGFWEIDLFSKNNFWIVDFEGTRLDVHESLLTPA